MSADLPFRRLRGVLGTALIWALVWLPIGVVLLLWRNSRDIECFYCPPALSVLGIWTGWGAVSGAVFATVLMIAERRHALAELSIGRIAVWGALGALSAPLAITVAEVMQPGPYTDLTFTAGVLGLSALLGAGCASGTVALARRATL